MTRIALTTIALMAGLVAGTPHAEARVVRFLGPHPIAPTVGEGMCHIEGPHVHSYAPHKSVLYVQQGPAYVFVGDPVEFEAKPPKHAYYGHHPVFWSGQGEQGPDHYCYLSGPHFHWYAPPLLLKAKFSHRGGAYWYVGGHPKGYNRHHWRGPALARHYAAVSLHVPWPVIVVGPPAGWVGVVVAPGDVRVKLKGHHGKLEIKGGPWWHVKGHGMHHGMHHGHGHVKIKGHGHGGAHVDVKVKGGHGKVKVKW